MVTNWGKTYRGVTVVLDRRRFVGCRFVNCRYVVTDRFSLWFCSMGVEDRLRMRWTKRARDRRVEDGERTLPHAR